MRHAHRLAVACTLGMVVAALAPSAARAGEDAIVQRIEEFFASGDAAARAKIAAAIARDPAFERARLSEWLHRARLFAAEPAGRVDLVVDVGLGRSRRVVVRVPQGYDPGRAYPLLYLLHPSGGSGPSFLYYAERNLGPRVEEWIVAAPSDYRQTGLDAPAPFTADHSAILRAVRTRFNVDADRQYAMGFSLGGYASWNMALLHAEEMAGAVPVGSCITQPPLEDGLWAEVLPDLARVPVLNVWGDRDGLRVQDSLGQDAGTVVELNHRFIALTAGMDLPIRHLEVAGAGHTDIPLAWSDLEPVLTHRRPHYPPRVDHTFRHLHQGRAYWLEAAAWEGDRWGDSAPAFTAQPGESQLAAFGRTVRPLLGNLQGEVDGQAVRIASRHVAELTVWVGDEVGEERRDWRLPVTLWQDGRRLFRGRLKPDLLLALTQAERTRDFENLRWSGWRVDTATGKARVVTAATPFPPLVP